ncbi:MAG TPA: hypothetical protein DDW27_12775 [Bacteroidales bacterium]|nr:hypothetical protein [Bacteroidales bacterium]
MVIMHFNFGNSNFSHSYTYHIILYLIKVDAHLAINPGNQKKYSERVILLYLSYQFIGIELINLMLTIVIQCHTLINYR